MIVKMIILRLLGSSDDKEKIGVARPEGPPYGAMDTVSGEPRISERVCHDVFFHS